MNNTKLFSLATMAAVLMSAGAAFALPPHVGLAAAHYGVRKIFVPMIMPQSGAESAMSPLGS